MYEYTVCQEPLPKSIDNPISDGGPCMNKTSSLKDSSFHQSQTSSPVSVLQRRRSYSSVKKKATKRARSEKGRFVKCNSLQGLQSIVLSFPATEKNMSIEPDSNSESSLLDETTEPNPGKQLRTKKISDLLLLGAGDNQATQINTPEFHIGQALEKSGPWEKDQDLNPTPTRKTKLQKMEVKKCIYCESTETPQWRDGPMGRGTLCNACGVQYRHGRLFPDYRPIKSPTFNPSLHSNLKPNTKRKQPKMADKKCMRCESTETPQWSNGSMGQGTLCNACDVQYKHDRLFPKYHPAKSPTFKPSLHSKPKPTPKKKQPKMAVMKCMHCESTKTPQWRDGPMGRGTLCNACGVQYRNGKLFPEYRPLKSPTFNPSLHSNLLKKVEQIRMHRNAKKSAVSGEFEHQT